MLTEKKNRHLNEGATGHQAAPGRLFEIKENQQVKINLFNLRLCSKLAHSGSLLCV